MLSVAEAHLKEKSFMLYVSSLTSQPSVGQLKQQKLHSSILDLFSSAIQTLSW